MTEAQLVELTKRYQARLNHSATTTAQTASAIWDSLGSWDQADVERFATRMAPHAEAGQRAGASLAVAFIGLLVGERFQPSPPSLEVDWSQPFFSYWKALADGRPWVEAITSGRSRAEAVAFDSVQSSARAATSEVDSQSETIVGWSRVPGGLACDWCATVADQLYHSAESADFGHDRCDCSVVPETVGRVMNRDLSAALRVPADEQTGYVDTLTGEAADRPAPAPVEEP